VGASATWEKSMARVKWGPGIEIGIGIVDKQHRGLVNLINELGTAMDEGRTQEQMTVTMAELVAYTHTHFRTEEVLLERYGYEAKAEHHHEHQIFTDQIEIYRDRFEAGSLTVSEPLMDYLSGWLVTHITVSDRAYLPTLLAGGAT